MASSDSQIDKPQCGHPNRAELPDININTGVQSFNTERQSFFKIIIKIKINLINSTLLCIKAWDFI